MRKISTAACFCILSFFSFGQLPEKIVAALDSFALIRPQEKTYLQTDRNNYLAGETIWFKAYAMLNGRPTVLSKILYVELLDAQGKILQKKMLKLQDGMVNGNIDLAADMPQNNYYLRCYSMWMMNFPEFITGKMITVLNNAKAKPSGAAKNLPAINISFFPEGGDLVNGLKSVVAFKALDENGRPLQVNGDIVNAKDEKVASFSTAHDGMGSFEVTANGPFTALIHAVNGAEKTVALPVARMQGITLTIDNSNLNKTFARIERSEQNKAQYNNLIVMAQVNYQVVYMAQLNMDEGQDAVAINKKNLPPGIMQVAVLSAEGVPLAERIVFVGNHQIDNGLLHADTVNTAKRKKNVLSFNIPDYSGLHAAASVVNAAADGSVNGANILSSLLLSSDLKGNIHEPGYYFKDQSAQTLQHLDLLMLTQGWRRFRLHEMLGGVYSQLSYPFETGLSITGKVLESNGKTVLKSGKVNMVIKGEDSTTIMSEAKLNPSSVFVVSNIDFKKEATVYYQGSNREKANAVVSVKIDPLYFDTVKTAKPVWDRSLLFVEDTSMFNDKMLVEKRRSDSSKMLKGVTVTARKRSPADSLNHLYASDLFFDSDQTLAVNSNINYPDIWSYLQSMVPGIMVNKVDTGIQVVFSRFAAADYFSGETSRTVQFYLNEVPVAPEIVDAVNMNDVGMIKIFKDNTAAALGGSSGAIAIYTVKGESGRDWRQKGFDFFKRSGYSVNREFYRLDYSRLSETSLFTDIRPTIYWNPDVKVSNGKAIIEFYNDDVCKRFKVVIEGMDANGKLLHLEKWIE